MKTMTLKQERERALKLARRIAHALIAEDCNQHGMRSTPEWEAYKAAKKRCNCKTDKDFRHYGQRGIRFCFSSFKDFYWAVGPRPSAAFTLDRINNDGNYEAGNVRWATRSQQQRNKRKPTKRAQAVNA